MNDVGTSGYRQILLDDPPLSINARPILPDGEDGSGIEGLTEDSIVVPILISKHSQEADTISLFSCMKGVPKLLRVRAQAVTLSFAVTDYKLQGKTKDELILSIAPRPFPRTSISKAFMWTSPVLASGQACGFSGFPQNTKAASNTSMICSMLAS